MPTWTLSLSGATLVNGTKSYTISDADVNSWIAYLQAKYKDPVTGVAPTPQQALLLVANEIVQDQTERSKRYKDALDRAAVNNPPIEFLP